MSHHVSSKLTSIAGSDLSSAALYKILELRSAVFVVEQQCVYQELDGLDLRADTTHLWYEDHDGITAYLRLLTEGDEIRIGRVLTRADCRRAGLSTRLLTMVLRQTDPTTTLLNAQSYLTDFYASFGYEISGSEHIEDGIPHMPMRRTVAS